VGPRGLVWTQWCREEFSAPADNQNLEPRSSNP